jgi:hypothetical protein
MYNVPEVTFVTAAVTIWSDGIPADGDAAENVNVVVGNEIVGDGGGGGGALPPPPPPPPQPERLQRARTSSPALRIILSPRSSCGSQSNATFGWLLRCRNFDTLVVRTWTPPL